MQEPKKIELAADTITAGDYDKLSDWLKSYPRLTKGSQTIGFEKEWAENVGSKYAVFVNSGSSANLLMVYSLIASGRFEGTNKKVVIPALSWITDISPVIQFGLEPVLVDCNMDDLSVDIDHLKVLFETEKPVCMILVPVLGLVPEMKEITDLCEKNNVILLIDNCESQGSLFMGRRLETYGLMASCSSYFGHIMSTIEGGVITTDDEDLYDLLKMLRSHGWGRDISDKKKGELETRYNISPFNSLYTFYYPAFNLRSTDLQAFIGRLQLQRLGQVTWARNENYKVYNEQLHNNYWKPTNKDLYAFISNMGYPVIHPNRDLIVTDLQENNVEVRPLISGSMGNQPFFVERYGKQVLPNVDKVDKFGFYVPNHPYLEETDIKRICSIINIYTGD